MADHLHLSNLLPQTKIEAAIDAAGGAAMTSPLWLPWLKEASEIAGLLLPVAGLTLIAVQIVARIVITRKILRDGRRE